MPVFAAGVVVGLVVGAVAVLWFFSGLYTWLR